MILRIIKTILFPALCLIDVCIIGPFQLLNWIFKGGDFPAPFLTSIIYFND